MVYANPSTLLRASALMPRILIAFDGSDASRRAVERVTSFMKEA
jgi:nucleotide-binding universal stress UspA family protein